MPYCRRIPGVSTPEGIVPLSASRVQSGLGLLSVVPHAADASSAATTAADFAAPSGVSQDNFPAFAVVAEGAEVFRGSELQLRQISRLSSGVLTPGAIRDPLVSSGYAFSRAVPSSDPKGF